MNNTHITVHYDNGKIWTFTYENPEDSIWNIGFKFDNTYGVFLNSGAVDNVGYFEVVEKSEDGKDVWVEYHGQEEA